jgi:hypothetical protein
MSSHVPSEAVVSTALTCGAEKLWLAGGCVLCYRFTETTRTTVDAAVDDARAELLGWDAARPWRLLLDIRDQAMVSAYGLHRGRELTRLRPDVGGKVAIVANNVLTAQIAAMALRGLPNERRRRLVFSNESEAVAWLLQDDKINLRA